MSTQSGIRDWLLQRISAVYLAGFVLFLFVSLSTHTFHNGAEWRAWVADPLVSICFGLFFVALLIHAWVGLHDVILDYIQPFLLRLVVLVLLGIAWTGLGLWSLRILVLND